jgi:hypothetical protein
MRSEGSTTCAMFSEEMPPGALNGILPKQHSSTPPVSDFSKKSDYPAVPLDGDSPFDTIREFYLYQEPALLGAIRLSDRREARRVINHLLVHIYSAGQERSELLTGLLLVLVVLVEYHFLRTGVKEACKSPRRRCLYVVVVVLNSSYVVMGISRRMSRGMWPMGMCMCLIHT